MRFPPTAKLAENVPVYPEIHWHGSWWPICGHWFWDNDEGAATFCRMLGFESGKRKVTRAIRPRDAIVVGNCKRLETLTECSGGQNHFGDPAKNPKAAMCAKGQNIGVQVTCLGTPLQRKSCSNPCVFRQCPRVEILNAGVNAVNAVYQPGYKGNCQSLNHLSRAETWLGVWSAPGRRRDVNHLRWYWPDASNGDRGWGIQLQRASDRRRGTQVHYLDAKHRAYPDALVRDHWASSGHTQRRRRSSTRYGNPPNPNLRCIQPAKKTCADGDVRVNPKDPIFESEVAVHPEIFWSDRVGKLLQEVDAIFFAVVFRGYTEVTTQLLRRQKTNGITILL